MNIYKHASVEELEVLIQRLTEKKASLKPITFTVIECFDICAANARRLYPELSQEQKLDIATAWNALAYTPLRTWFYGANEGKNSKVLQLGYDMQTAIEHYEKQLSILRALAAL